MVRIELRSRRWPDAAVELAVIARGDATRLGERMRSSIGMVAHYLIQIRKALSPINIAFFNMFKITGEGDRARIQIHAS